MQRAALFPSVIVLAGLSALSAARSASAGDLTVELGRAEGVKLVGAFNRWDQDGNPREVNTKAKIERPEVDAVATDTGGGRWVFKGLPEGKYDLVILRDEKVRLEGWHYAPVLEFDPFFPPDATVSDEVRDLLTQDITASRHYENKVVPLFMGGDEKVARVLVMLIRDLPTSYEREMPGAATIRFEIWQYDWKYGGWVKQRRTRVLHRVILPRDELRQWTWLWDPRLGGIEVGPPSRTIKYGLPRGSEESLKGLRAY